MHNMIQVRNNVFETNSSSTHSICIPKKTNMTAQFIDFRIGEYGWENRRVDDTASYLYTAILYLYGEDNDVLEEKLDIIKTILNEHGIGYSFEKPEWRYYNYDGSRYLDNGYIDHGSETYEFVNAVLDDEDMLLRYLFDGVIYTGNDNQESQPYGCNISDAYYWEYDSADDWKGKEVPNPYHDEENFDYFYKGN